MLIQAQVLAASSLTTDQIIDVVAILVPLLIAFGGNLSDLQVEAQSGANCAD